MIKIISKINSRFMQALGLFSVNLVGIPLGIITSIILTKYLGAREYGDLKFVTNIFSLASVIFTLGFYQAGSRALVTSKDATKAKEYYGIELSITAIVYIAMAISLVIYAEVDRNIHAKKLNEIFLYAIPLGWVFLLQKYFEILLQADNKIKILAKTRLYPQIFFLILISLIYHSGEIFTGKLLIIWLSYMASQAIAYLMAIYQLDVSFKNIRIRTQEIWNHNKSYGLNVYLGSLFAVGFAQLSGIFISYHGDNNAGVGFYSLALTLSTPLAFIPNTIATTHFKDFSNQKKISRNLIIITVALSCAALLALWAITTPLVNLFYGEDFKSIASLNYIISIGMLAHGLGDFFNRYIGANGHGKILRNTSVLVGIAILSGNLILIPKWGEYGAAYTHIISGFTYLITMVASYLNIKNNPSTIKN